MTFGITLTHITPENLWTAMAFRDGGRWHLGGLFRSAEAALAACWLTTDERITLPAIADMAQVKALIDARLSTEDAEAVEEASILLAGAGRNASGTTHVVTEVIS